MAQALPGEDSNRGHGAACESPLGPLLPRTVRAIVSSMLFFSSLSLSLSHLSLWPGKLHAHCAMVTRWERRLWAEMNKNQNDIGRVSPAHRAPWHSHTKKLI